MAATTPQIIPKVAHEGLIQHHRHISQVVDKQWNLREQMRQIDLAYLRENDFTKEHQRAKISNSLGDTNRIQNITVPVIKPQVNSAVGYQAAVFLGEYPLFPVISAPQYINEALQMQAILEEQSIHGGWTRELLLFFFDGFKYNLSFLEAKWDKVTTAAIETDLTFQGGKEGKPKQLIWEGNCLKRWDPYNTWFDTTVVPYDLPSMGDFAGTTELMTKNRLITFLNSLETRQPEWRLIEAYESPSLLTGSGGTYGASYYLPPINPEALVSQDPSDSPNWDAWAGLAALNSNRGGVNFKGLYEVSTEYVRIVPKDFSLMVPAKGTPQVWKLIIVNHHTIVYAERQTNAHEKIPVFIGQPSEDGLAFQTKSLASDALPFQQVSSALMNATLASRRRAITDRILYDPSRVLESHINNPNPSAKIPVRPSAFGKNVSEAVYQFPFRDDQAGINMQEIQAVVQFGNILNGQNPARQGQFVKGNKTDGQWDAVMSNATSNDQMVALKYEAQVFTPLKEVLKLNILQYQPTASYYSPSQKQQVQIDPLALRQAVVKFKVTDGYTPKEKVISGEALKVGMQVIGTSPTLAQGYNIAPMFSYIMKTENVDLTPFEKSPAQVAYEQAVNTWTQMATLAIQKQTPFNTPQPIPAQFGYDPNMMNPQMNPDAHRAQTAPGTQMAGNPQPMMGQ